MTCHSFWPSASCVSNLFFYFPFSRVCKLVCTPQYSFRNILFYVVLLLKTGQNSKHRNAGVSATWPRPLFPPPHPTSCRTSALRSLPTLYPAAGLLGFGVMTLLRSLVKPSASAGFSPRFRIKSLHHRLQPLQSPSLFSRAASSTPAVALKQSASIQNEEHQQQKPAAMDAMTKQQYLADSPPTVVRLEIKPHFEALETEKQRRYAHFISR